jgi:hypothetical protein
MARYPELLDEKEWKSFMLKVKTPLDSDSKKKIHEMIQRGSKIKIHI